jgi:NAD(P)H-dependent FMN reductase
MTRIAIILASTRPNRRGDQVAAWVHDVATRRTDAEFALLDLRDHPLPHLDEPEPPARGDYRHEHTRAWAATIAPFDGFVFVTCEYNHTMPGVLKNALDHLYAEWANKAVGLVSYGGLSGGSRAAEQLRLVCGALGLADVSRQVVLSVVTEFADFTRFAPSAFSAGELDAMLDEVVAWSGALAPLRAAVAGAG